MDMAVSKLPGSSLASSFRPSRLSFPNLLQTPKRPCSQAYSARVKSLLWLAPPKTVTAPLDADPARVSVAVENAFTKLDEELLQAPLRVLANNMAPEDHKNKVISRFKPASSCIDYDASGSLWCVTRFANGSSSLNEPFLGSCALMAIFDTAHRDLYVACVGDSRAVAGVWEPSSDQKGQWRIEVLSEDQTGRKPFGARAVKNKCHNLCLRYSFLN